MNDFVTSLKQSQQQGGRSSANREGGGAIIKIVLKWLKGAKAKKPTSIEVQKGLKKSYISGSI